jgi:hypothetical protein
MHIHSAITNDKLHSVPFQRKACIIPPQRTLKLL